MPLNFIETHTGAKFEPLDPSIELIRIQDIAHALSQQCRFSGHTSVFYSVAEHSVRVSRLLEEWGADPVTVLWGLLHDASEAYLVDIPSPLKRSPAFASYREAEAGLMRMICARFGLPGIEPADVRRADAVLLATEARSLMPFVPDHWGGLTEAALGQDIIPWPSEFAKREFVNRFVRFARYGRV